MADKRTEQIKFETELLRLIVLLGVAIGGGSFTGGSFMTPSEWLAAGMGVTLLLAVLVFAVAITRH